MHKAPAHRKDGYIPRSIRQSKTATWLWLNTGITYEQAKRIAKLFPNR